MELSIIFVNWNSVNYLRECLASIYEHTQGIALEIIVVDNASSVGDVDTLKADFPQLTTIKSTVNLGFAGANNLGYRNSSGAYLLFLNPDTSLTNPAINLMLERLKSLPDAGVVGCKLLNSDLSVQTSCIQKFPTILNQVADIEYLRLRWPSCRLWEIHPLFSIDVKPTKVEVVSGACMMLKRAAFEQAGLFSEDYFMYAEDMDLCYKSNRIGLTNYYIGEATVIHHGGKSSTQRKASQWATVMKSQAMLQFCRKTRGRSYAMMYRIAMACAATGRLMVLTLMFPLGGLLLNKAAIREASSKWSAVLKWAVGLGDWARQER